MSEWGFNTREMPDGSFYATPKDFKHMTTNIERVQKYAKSNRGLWRLFSGDKPKLTPKQMRRVRKNANKFPNSESFKILTLDRPHAFTDGYSLIARTPEGMGIFYRFV
jgi:hypothetical protein